VSGHDASRRGFLTTVMGASLTLVAGPGLTPALRDLRLWTQIDHPEPRPDVDASNVLSEAQLAGFDHVIELYNGIRKIPHIADGIRCMCGCAELPGFRSLLTCFESNGMGMSCEICQTEGRMVVRYHNEGRTLDQIRAAITARFG